MQPGPFFLPRWVVAKEAPAHSSDAHWVTRRGPTPRRRPALIGFNLSMRGWGGGRRGKRQKKKPKKRSQAARSGSRAKKLTCKSPLQPHSGGRRGPSPPPHCRPRGRGRERNSSLLTPPVLGGSSGCGGEEGGTHKGTGRRHMLPAGTAPGRTRWRRGMAASCLPFLTGGGGRRGKTPGGAAQGDPRCHRGGKTRGKQQP